MKTIIALIISLSLFIVVYAQPDKTYLFSKQIANKLKNDTTSYANEKAAWEYSFIQEYQKALWAYDQKSMTYPILTEEQKEYFLSYKPVDAIDFIVEKAENEQIIMINEAHHQPLHRIFTTLLLEALYKKGFHLLGLEAFSYNDSLLNKRGYPILETGFYTQEPQFGNLIRTALELGYKVFPYETKIQANRKEREIQQAKNIAEIIKRHPDEKLLIHCGYDHIIESNVPNWEKAMAGRLKELTGIDPLTINQEILTEHYFTEKENPFYELVDYLNESTLFINEYGDMFHGLPGDNRFDVRMFHPRTKYLNGRPDWLSLNGKRKFYIIDKKSITIDYPVLIKAYKRSENENAIPIDIIEIKDLSDQKALVLPPGDYKFKIINIDGDSIIVNETL